MDKKTVCAIIPTYNRKELAEECLLSLLAQTLPPDEIIMVDDGSTDGTEEFFQKYKDRITYIKKPNGGKSSALNLGISKASADYIWICDDDDYAAKDGLENLYKALEAHPDAGFSYGDFQMFQTNTSGKRFIDPYFKPRADEPNLLINLLEDMFILQFAMLVKKSVYEEVGPFNEAMIRSQDYEMALRLARAAKGVHAPHIIFYQRLHDGERGASHDRFQASETHVRWLKFDTMIFSRVEADYGFEEFTPSFALNWNKDLQMRATYLERGLVFARRGLWDRGIEDLRKALVQSGQSLTKEEKNICETLVRKPTSWVHLVGKTGNLDILRGWYKQGGTGETIIMALCRPLGWMTKSAVKKKDFKAACSYLNLMLRILGPFGTAKRFLLSVQKS